MNYTEVTTSFMIRGLIQNSVQVAKLTVAVQYLWENQKKTHFAQTGAQWDSCATDAVSIKISKKLPTLKLYK